MRAGHGIIPMPQKKNYSGFALVGAGLPRTGTTSLRAALGILLDGACHHMQDVGRGNAQVGSNITTEQSVLHQNLDKLEESSELLQDIEFWYKAMEGEVTSQEWVDKLQGGGYRSGVDYPISLFYK